jgi:hypothetical protein
MEITLIDHNLCFILQSITVGFDEFRMETPREVVVCSKECRVIRLMYVPMLMTEKDRMKYVKTGCKGLYDEIPLLVSICRKCYYFHPLLGIFVVVSCS